MTFPLTPNSVAIELYYDGTWNDITQYVYHRDMAPISIDRGRSSEGKHCDPGVMRLTLNNRDGRFTADNPNSALFGKIGLGTRIRVKVTYGAVTYIRFDGEVPSWPPRWDVSQKDIWVNIEAAGILRRLGQGSKPLKSPLYRSMIGITAGDVVPYVYWSLEDGPQATAFAPALAGTPAIPGVSEGDNAVEFASDSSIIGSDLLPTLTDGTQITFTIPPYTDTGLWVLQIALNHHTADTAPTVAIKVGSFDIVAATTLGELEAFAFGPSGLIFSNSDLFTEDYLSRPLSLIVASVDTGGGDTFVTRLMNDLGETVAQTIDVNPGVYGMPTTVTVHVPTGLGDQQLAVGHATLFTDPTFDHLTDGLEGARAMSGWTGEQAHERFERLCAQLGIPYATIGEQSALMGPERLVAFLQAQRDTADTDQGFLFELREELGLQFRTNSSRYNQVPIALDYDVGHISAPFDPEPDDKQVFNDREVKRRNGSQARRELPSGPLSVQDPPLGAGRREDSITVDAYSDIQLPHIANWRLHVGTWKAPRYPRVTVDLAVPGNASIVPAIAGADSGDLITIDNLPAWLPPEQAQLLIEGYRENIGFYTWDFTFNCSPAGPYNVVGRWPLISKELHTAMNTSVTSADIANTSTTQPMLETSAALIGSGYPITIGGEQLQLTAVAASLATFGSAGTASTGGSGSRTPGLPASAASGNLILIFASTRNSGTGSVDTPTNWTRLPIFAAASNCAVFGRIYDGVWSMPTVTYTAGAANEDTIAQSLRLGGNWHSVANVCIAAAPKLNASAQNIAYPGMPKPACDNAIVLYFGWKQDDYTSVVSPGTEVQEASTTTGNDASQVWSYTIQTTATAIAPGSFAVTGGASAISRGAVAFLRCDYQTATVTRSTNGVSASHAAADAVVATNPLRWGLL